MGKRFELAVRMYLGWLAEEVGDGSITSLARLDRAMAMLGLADTQVSEAKLVANEVNDMASWS